MLALFRRGLNTWVARGFFLVLLAAFTTWGVGDVVRNIGVGDGSIATVAGRRIDLPEAQDMYRRQLEQVTRMFGGKLDATAEIRRSVAEQTVERLVTQTAIMATVADLGLVASDDAVREAVYAIPQLRGVDGKFSQDALDQALRNNGLTKQRFAELMRDDLGQRQLLEAVTAGTAIPDAEAREVYAFQNEKRIADAVEFPLASQPDPAAPTEAQLKRWYDNHPEDYRTPELRRIKAVILSPETVAKEFDVTEDDLKAAWEQVRSTYEKPEKRSVEVITAPDAAKAGELAAAWRNGADWTAMQAAAKAAGATTVAITDAARAEFPAAELADAVFATDVGGIAGPVKGPLGDYVLQVTKIDSGGGKTFEQVRDELRARVLAEKAADVIDARANKIDQLLTSGTSLDDLPTDLGLFPATGTLDAQGNTAAGAPVPIPGSPDLKTALVQAAFQMKVGDPPRLTQAPNDPNGAVSYFAVQVESITPPATRPYADVADKVRAAWTHDAIRHAAETAAAKLLTAVNGGESLADAATVAGVSVRRLPAVGRSSPVDGVPAQLVNPLFGLKKGEAAEVETGDGFMIAVLAEIDTPDPASDPLGFGQTRDALNKALQQDIQAVFAAAVRDRARPRINAGAIEQLDQADAQ